MWGNDFTNWEKGDMDRFETLNTPSRFNEFINFDKNIGHKLMVATNMATMTYEGHLPCYLAKPLITFLDKLKFYQEWHTFKGIPIGMSIRRIFTKCMSEGPAFAEKLMKHQVASNIIRDALIHNDELNEDRNNNWDCTFFADELFPWQPDCPPDLMDWALRHNPPESLPKVSKRESSFKEGFLNLLSLHVPNKLPSLTFEFLNGFMSGKSGLNGDLTSQPQYVNAKESSNAKRWKIPHKFTFKRIEITKSPTETRDGVIGDFGTIGVIKTLESWSNWVNSFIPYAMLGKRDPKGPFFNRRSKRGKTYLCLDIRKCGLTFPHELLEWSGDVLAEYFNEPLFRKYALFKDADIWVDGKKHHLKRGYCLGMGNGIATMIIAYIFQNWRETEWGCFFNDDSVLEFDLNEETDERVDSWKKELAHHGIKVKEKGTYMTGNPSFLRTNLWESWDIDPLRPFFRCINTLHSFSPLERGMRLSSTILNCFKAEVDQEATMFFLNTWYSYNYLPLLDYNSRLLPIHWGGGTITKPRTELIVPHPHLCEYRKQLYRYLSIKGELGNISRKVFDKRPIIFPGETSVQGPLSWESWAGARENVLRVKSVAQMCNTWKRMQNAFTEGMLSKGDFSIKSLFRMALAGGIILPPESVKHWKQVEEIKDSNVFDSLHFIEFKEGREEVLGVNSQVLPREYWSKVNHLEPKTLKKYTTDENRVQMLNLYREYNNGFVPDEFYDDEAYPSLTKTITLHEFGLPGTYDDDLHDSPLTLMQKSEGDDHWSSLLCDSESWIAKYREDLRDMVPAAPKEELDEFEKDIEDFLNRLRNTEFETDDIRPKPEPSLTVTTEDWLDFDFDDPDEGSDESSSSSSDYESSDDGTSDGY